MKHIRNGLWAAFCASLFALCGALGLTSCSDDFWELSKYTVSYRTAHDSAPSSRIVEYGTKLTSDYLASVECAGYKFEGWYLSTDKKQNIIEADKEEVKGSITLVAKWTGDGTANVTDRLSWLTLVPGDGKVTVTISATDAPEFTTVAIHYSTSELFSSVPVTISASEFGSQKYVAKDISGLTNGTTYYFRVIAYKNSKETSRVQKSVTPSASSGGSPSGTGPLVILVQ